MVFSSEEKHLDPFRWANPYH